MTPGYTELHEASWSGEADSSHSPGASEKIGLNGLMLIRVTCLIDGISISFNNDGL